MKIYLERGTENDSYGNGNENFENKNDDKRGEIGCTFKYKSFTFLL